MSEELKILQEILEKGGKYAEIRKALADILGLELVKKSDSIEIMEPTYYVGLVIIDKTRRFILLGKRKGDGYWTGPGGGAGMDESPKEAAIREAFEEANLQLRPYQLKELPTLQTKDGKLCHTFLAFVDKKEAKLHVTNDPDAEIREWGWYKLNDPLPGKTDENRLLTINAAKMKVFGLKKCEEILKSIVSNPQAEIDINTAEESMNELAIKPSDANWVARIDELVKDASYGEEPKSLPLPAFKTLYISKVDEGIYSGFVRLENPEDGNNGETLTHFDKMTSISMVQALKAKGYIPMEVVENKEEVKEEKQESVLDREELRRILEGISKPEIHIHINKAKVL